MNRTFLLFLVLISLYAQSQEKIHCEGLKSLAIKISVILDSKPQHKVIRKSDLLKNDLKILLNDSACQLIGFIAGYDCHSGGRSLVFDYNEKTFFGNTIKAKDPFIKEIWVGDMLSFECINVRKKGKLFLLPGISFNVID